MSVFSAFSRMKYQQYQQWHVTTITDNHEKTAMMDNNDDGFVMSFFNIILISHTNMYITC